MIEINQDEEAEDNADQIDNEEVGGVWITEENIHKHLSHGVLLPIGPTTESVEEMKAEGTTLQAVQEETANEEENTEFPAFDEA